MCKKLAIISGVLFTAGCLIYFPIQYLIYYPYFDLPWEESECIINSSSRSKIFWYESKDGTKHYLHYTLINVNVNIKGRWLQGFGCGCSEASAESGQTLVNDVFPYKYTYCPHFSQCKDMIIMPAWYCIDCNNCKKNLNSTQKKCRYFLKKGNDVISDIDEISENYKLEYPTVDSTYIQVTFREHQFYRKSEYLAMKIIALGIMILLPAFILICMCLFFVGKCIIRKFFRRYAIKQVIISDVSF